MSATEQRLTANRTNALHSTGPSMVEGQEIAGRNAWLQSFRPNLLMAAQVTPTAD